MGKLLIFIAFVAAVAIQEVSRNVVNWVSENPTMWLDSVGFLIPFLLIFIMVIGPKIINRLK